MRRNLGGNLNIGASSLLLIFIVLSLVSFAVLSLSSSINDKNIVDDSLKRSQSYYSACNDAQHWLAETNALLSADGNVGASSDLTHTFTINDSQELHVAIQPIPEDENGYKYTITEWRVVNTEIHEIDNHLNLLIPQ